MLYELTTLDRVTLGAGQVYSSVLAELTFCSTAVLFVHPVPASSRLPRALCAALLSGATQYNAHHQESTISAAFQLPSAKQCWKAPGAALVQTHLSNRRAIYFYAYAQSKKFLCERMHGETHTVHILSAAAAGFSAATTTNPLWVIKTRLQLDQRY